jgi:hypothetical protein
MRRVFALFMIFIAFSVSAAAEIHAVNFSDSCAVINSNGNRIFNSAKYDLIFALKDEKGKITGYAAGITTGNYGEHYALLSPAGDRQTDFIYNFIAPAGNGFIASRRDVWYCLTSSGKSVGKTYSAIEYIGNNTCFAVSGDPYDEISDRLVILTTDGAVRVPGVDIQYGLAQFSDGLMPIADGNTLLYGYVNSRGTWALDPAYKYAGSFMDKRAIIAGEAGYGLIDQLGNEIISPEYDFMTRSGGLVCAVKNDAAYIITTDGQLLFKTSLKGASASLTGAYLVITASDEVRVMDASGALIFTCSATSSVEAVGDHFIVRSGQWSASQAQLTDLSGSPVSPAWASLTFLENGMFSYGMRNDAGEIQYGLYSAEKGALTDCNYASVTLIEPGLYIGITDDGAALIDDSGAARSIS